MKNRIQSVFLFLFLTSLPLWAAVYHVPSDYTTIQDALNFSVAGDSILVAPGTYHENITWPQVDGITLLGTAGSMQTIIDANHNGRVVTMYSPWDAPVITLATKLQGFTLRNGFLSGNGAGLLCNYASPTLTDLIICRNEISQMGSGGGLYCYHASPVLTDVVLAYNIAYSGGGAHIDPVSSPVFNHCVIADNTLFSTGGSYAAGIYGRYEVYFQLNHCTVTRNRFWETAAIHLGEVCTPTISHSTICDNTYGIMVVANGGISMNNCTIRGNDTDGLWHFDTSGDVLDVSGNWWGAASGPFHETVNPQGTGDGIAGLVTFAPYLTAEPEGTAPTPPVGLTVGTITNNTISLAWSANPEPGIDYYEVRYGSDTLAVVLPTMVQTPVNQCTLTDLTPGTRYAIQVAAHTTMGEKSWFSSNLMVQTTGTANDDPVVVAPVGFSVYPNPFGNSASLKFELKQPGQTTLAVYNLKGELVKTVKTGLLMSGTHVLNWDGRNEGGKNVANGVYLARLTYQGMSQQYKLIHLK